MQCNIYRELDSVARVMASGGQLSCSVLQGLDLRSLDIDWDTVECEGSVFLGCQLPAEVSVAQLSEKGALFFPGFHNLPYHPYRPTLYTREELMAGWTPEVDASLDRRIYDHFMAKGKHQPDILEALAERLHDHAIDDALADLLEGRIEQDGRKKVVAIMGGHGTSRADPFFHKVAHLARLLTRAGYFIATGGGPGMMEAGNLGAYLAEAEAEELDAVLASLAAAPVYTSPGYREAGRAVLARFPHGHTSLAVPTWFYGHEPTNLFASYVAKYFSNSIREDGLLAIATHGIVFSPGSAGTTQEIFQDAAQNHYASLGHVSPMVFLGEERYTRDTMLYQCLRELARGRIYEEMLFLSDDVAEITDFITTHPPLLSSDGTA